MVPKMGVTAEGVLCRNQSMFMSYTVRLFENLWGPSGTFGRLSWSDGPQFFARHGPRTLLQARPGVSTDVVGAALGSVVPESLGSVQTKDQFYSVLGGSWGPRLQYLFVHFCKFGPLKSHQKTH